jgi:chitodextrinase
MTYTVLRAADTTAPTAPYSLVANANQRQKQIELSWSAATDNVGVIGYRVLRDGVVVAIVINTRWSDPSVNTGTTYTYHVVADDAAGNVSPRSNSVYASLSSGGKKR